MADDGSALSADQARRMVAVLQSSRHYAAEVALREILRNVRNRASMGQTSLCWELRTRHMWLPMRADQAGTGTELVSRLQQLGYDSELLFGRFVYVGWAASDENSEGGAENSEDEEVSYGED